MSAAAISARRIRTFRRCSATRITSCASRHHFSTDAPRGNVLAAIIRCASYFGNRCTAPPPHLVGATPAAARPGDRSKTRNYFQVGSYHIQSYHRFRAQLHPAANCRFYTTTLGVPDEAKDEAAAEKSRRTTIRLYRILLRQCREFPNVHVLVDAGASADGRLSVNFVNGEGANIIDLGVSKFEQGAPERSRMSNDIPNMNTPILLQPLIEPADWGRQSLYDSDIGGGDGHLIQFFRDWNIEIDFENDNDHDKLDNEDQLDEHDGGVPMSDAYRKLLHANAPEHVPLCRQSSIDEWYQAVTGSGPSTVLRFPTWTTPRELQLAIRQAFRTEYRDVRNGDRGQDEDIVSDSDNDNDGKPKTECNESDSDSDSDSDNKGGTTSDEDDHVDNSSESDSDSDNENDNESLKRSSKPSIPLSVLHHWAIRASQLLREQADMWQNASVTTTDNIRVTATSRCIGYTSPTSSLPTTVVPDFMETKYRFSYRIRIENLSSTEHVQLLGRYWHIQELYERSNGPSKGLNTGEGNGDSEESWRPPIIVNAPQTGAVGHLPVLKPGQCFEYMSGTDLATARGQMRGFFYMAKVPPDTNSARTGDLVEAMESPDKLQVTVSPFPLTAPGH